MKKEPEMTQMKCFQALPRVFAKDGNPAGCATEWVPLKGARVA